MFLFHAAITLGMVSLVAGSSQYIWSLRAEGSGKSLAKFFGFLVIVFSLGSILCTVYYGIMYWQQGYFQNPIAMMQGMQNGVAMAFLFHVAVTLGMISLTAGSSLYIWSLRNEGPGKGLAKFFGFLVIVFSLISIICTDYYGLMYWQKGYFPSPIATMQEIQNKSTM